MYPPTTQNKNLYCHLHQFIRCNAKNPEQVPVPEGITCTAPALWFAARNMIRQPGLLLSALYCHWKQSAEAFLWFFTCISHPGHRAAGFRRRGEELLAESLAGCWCPAFPHTAHRKDEQCTLCLPAVWCQICLAASISQLTAEGLGIFFLPPPQPRCCLRALLELEREGGGWSASQHWWND